MIVVAHSAYASFSDQDVASNTKRRVRVQRDTLRLVSSFSRARAASCTLASELKIK
jgi:hypothetical protein